MTMHIHCILYTCICSIIPSFDVCYDKFSKFHAFLAKLFVNFKRPYSKVDGEKKFLITAKGVVLRCIKRFRRKISLTICPRNVQPDNTITSHTERPPKLTKKYPKQSCVIRAYSPSDLMIKLIKANLFMLYIRKFLGFENLQKSFGSSNL